MMKTSRPAVTVVLPSHNEGDFVRITVEGILSQTDYPNYQIVIVDDASTDGSCDNLAGHSACKVVKTGGLGVAGARNFGAHVARGEILVFSMRIASCQAIGSPGWSMRSCFSKSAS